MSRGCQKDRQRQQDIRKTEKQADRRTDWQTDRKTDWKTRRLFSLVIKTKVVQNVNRMLERQKRQTIRQTDRQTGRVPGRQTEMAGQLKSPPLLWNKYDRNRLPDFSSLTADCQAFEFNMYSLQELLQKQAGLPEPNASYFNIDIIKDCDL